MEKDKLTESYIRLLEGEYKEKKLWEHIRDEELTAAYSFKGNLYEKSDAKLMVVGRAMNGWEDKKFKVCNSVEEVVNVVMGQQFDFKEIVSREGIFSDEQGGKRAYHYSTSNFFRLIKYVLEELGESEKGSDWYEDTMNWNQKFVWSNLYKVSPRHSDNPDWKLIKPQMREYIDIISEELELYHPKRVLFVTGAGYFLPWKKQPSFFKEFEFDNLIEDKTSCVQGSVIYDGIHMVLCKRPDAWGTSYDDIRKMAEEIRVAFVTLSKYVGENQQHIF